MSSRFPSSASSSGHDVWAAAAPKARRPYGTTKLKFLTQTDIHTPLGSFVQGHSVDSTTTSRASLSPVRSTPFFDGSVNMGSRAPSPRKDKRRAQFDRWQDRVIPALIEPYLQLIQESNNLRNIPREARVCSCMPTVHKLSVLCLSFDKLEVVKICSCSPAINLLAHGMFPSAPMRPSFAVDINLLTYLEELFVRSPPNITAWSGALESFLERRGYHLASPDTMRRKLGSALKWFQYLTAQVEKHVHDRILLYAQAEDENGSDIYSRPTTPDPPPSSSPMPSSSPVRDDVNLAAHVPFDPTITRPQTTTSATLHDSMGSNNTPPHQANATPIASNYLRRCCALCFGGAQATASGPEFVVCVDACFTHKRRTPARGKGREPPLVHPSTSFLTEEELSAAEAEVDLLRPTRSAPPGPVPNSTDAVEPGMKVPISALDGCLDSFTAADEKRVKASTKFFVDTGLMALLCRHDQVLWLANMTTPGERQFYVLALLEKLFSHIPPTATVGSEAICLGFM